MNNLKNIFNFLIVLSISSFSSCAQNQNEDVQKDKVVENKSNQDSKPFIESTKASDFKRLVDGGEGIILDVRTHIEYKQGHIKGASMVNYYDKDFESKINFIDKTKPIYLYCRSGGRSAKAAQILQKNGFNKIYELQNGMMTWKQNDFPIEKDSIEKDDNIKELSLEEFNKALKTDLPVLIDFHTVWCVPCRKMAPIIDKIEKQYKGKAVIMRVDVDKSKEVGKEYQIQGVPVFILFKDGKEQWKNNGIISDDELIKQIEAVL